ncbi:citrate synthase [Butyrivibrio proteoclasticus]|uniref:citrate synthase (unknown stereospecificity) n=1 Tax=Butyrivibrio proteoclasticus TaxID=43305 RepID=A0A1I5R0P1_9FIRM|nr:citrate/2-methylcitrate synthase [Butyrivibrio proteoclasticus]SFP52124.1 citrate synthase [Butyrivibrio proteoclasticus]
MDLGKGYYSDNTPEIVELSKLSEAADQIENDLFIKYDVKRGLRDLNGKGVLTGLTRISEIIAKEVVDGKEIPKDGEIYFRGYDVHNLIDAAVKENRFAFEECAYLLLFDKLPSGKELFEFEKLLGFYKSLPPSFVRDVIMKAPSRDMMNTLARSVLTLYAYDDLADDVSLPNVLRQSLQLISMFPLLSIYGYHAYNHYHEGNSLIIHPPREELSTAETILYLLRPDSKYTELEAKLLDICLVLHMEHGGGNNSSFTTHVVSSSLTDTYSVIAAAIGSLKGPRHGGANIKVVHMVDDIEENVKDWKDEEEVGAYLDKILNKEAFDRSGLIYGIGHAIYSKSDPRAMILKSFVEKLAVEKKREDELALYEMIERLAPRIISGERKMYKGVSANVDFYSGFVYRMLELPEELYPTIFAIARIVGWSAHRMEELANNGKIIRPAYMAIEPRKEYVPMSER